jgi:hypothetical protein
VACIVAGAVVLILACFADLGVELHLFRTADLQFYFWGVVESSGVTPPDTTPFADMGVGLFWAGVVALGIALVSAGLKGSRLQIVVKIERFGAWALWVLVGSAGALMVGVQAVAPVSVGIGFVLLVLTALGFSIARRRGEYHIWK